MTTYWRSLTPTRKLDFRCDLPKCDAKANTIHFVPYVDEDVETCLFACRDHDAGGYWTELSRWFNPQEAFIEHILEKHEGYKAIQLYNDRIEQLRAIDPADFTKDTDS